MRAVVQMTLARVHLARGKADKALKVLEPLYVPAETAGRFGQVIEICLLQALALQAQGNTAAALAQLERSLALAEPEGYARIYLDEGVPAARLLAAFCRAPSKPAHLQRYAQSLLAMFDDATKDKVQMTQASDSSSALRPSSLVEPLTKRELQVLRLMAADLSSPEIAEELVIAVSTARSHIKSIYGKLGAHSRYEAVERARALHLL
jgi:LuxR family maltose regulon positive regulatory protein